MSTAVLLAVIVTHEPGKPADKVGRPRRLVDSGLGHVAEGDSRSASDGGTIAATTAVGGTTAVAAGGSGTLAAREVCVTAAVIDPTPVHGWVEKAGSLPMHLLDGPDTKQRHQAYFTWRDTGTVEEQTQEALVNGVMTRVGRPPPLFPYCRILVNHAYRTMYLKAPKTGSTSLLTLMGTCTGNATTDKATCFQPLEVLENEADYETMYSNYFVFSVVRNPWARAVSSYRMLSRYMKHGCKDLVGGWNKVCMDVNHIPMTHNHHPLCTISKQQGEGFALHHFIPQAPCLVTATGKWAADYVVRTENLGDDMREVYAEMNARREPDAAELDVDGLLGQLRNVNRVNVACQGKVKPAQTIPVATAAGGSSSSGQLSKEIAAVARRKVLNAKKAAHLEAPESYCASEMYFEGQHLNCFDGIAAYYKEDLQLFGLPTCR